ncbi:MAG: regulatory protein RecX [Bacteroidota bacterium]
MNEEILGKIYKYCAYQDRSRLEITEKLIELGLEEEKIEPMMQHLKEERFWDEERFARSFARGKFSIKRWGRQKIRHELKAKKVPIDLIELAIDQEIEKEDYLKSLTFLTEKKFADLKRKNSYENRGKLYRFLHQKGYESDLIYEAITTVTH